MLITLLLIIIILHIVFEKNKLRIIMRIYLFFFFLTSIYGLKELLTISFFPQDLSKLFSFYELLMEKVKKKYDILLLSKYNEGRKLLMFLNVLISFLSFYIVFFEIILKSIKNNLNLENIEIFRNIYDYCFSLLFLVFSVIMGYFSCLVFVIWNENLITYFFDVLEKEHTLSLSQDVSNNLLRPLLSSEIEKFKKLLEMKPLLIQMAFEERFLKETISYKSSFEFKVLSSMIKNDVSIFFFIEEILYNLRKNTIIMWCDSFQSIKIEITSENYHKWKEISNTYSHINIEEEKYSKYIQLNSKNISFIVSILNGKEYHYFFNTLLKNNLLEEFINSMVTSEKSTDEVAPKKTLNSIILQSLDNIYNDSLVKNIRFCFRTYFKIWSFFGVFLWWIVYFK